MKTGDQVAVCGEGTSEGFSTRHVPLFMALRSVENRRPQRESREEDGSFKEAQLAMGPALGMESERDNTLRVEAFMEVLERATQTGVPLELL